MRGLYGSVFTGFQRCEIDGAGVGFAVAGKLSVVSLRNAALAVADGKAVSITRRNFCGSKNIARKSTRHTVNRKRCAAARDGKTNGVSGIRGIANFVNSAVDGGGGVEGNFDLIAVAATVIRFRPSKNVRAESGNGDFGIRCACVGENYRRVGR